MVLAMLVPIFTSSDDDLDEVEAAWTEVLERIDDRRPFGAAVDAVRVRRKFRWF